MNNSPVLGTGVDLVETERMQEVLERWGTVFKKRVFLADEQKYCEAKAAPFRHYAGRFAVKEAVSKAFGTGIGPHIGWLDMEVLRDPDTGAPSIRLHGKARHFAEKQNVGAVLISLAHTRRYAIAQALLISKPEPTAGSPRKRP